MCAPPKGITISMGVNQTPSPPRVARVSSFRVGTQNPQLPVSPTARPSLPQFSKASSSGKEYGSHNSVSHRDLVQRIHSARRRRNSGSSDRIVPALESSLSVDSLGASPPSPPLKDFSITVSPSNFSLDSLGHSPSEAFRVPTVPPTPKKHSQSFGARLSLSSGVSDTESELQSLRQECAELKAAKRNLEVKLRQAGTGSQSQVQSRRSEDFQLMHTSLCVSMMHVAPTSANTFQVTPDSKSDFVVVRKSDLQRVVPDVPSFHE